MSKDTNQYTLPSPPTDIISSTTFLPNSSTHLLVSSWNRHVYHYDLSASPQLLRTYEYRAPILDICAGEDDTHFFSVGLDWDVRKVDIATGEQTVLSTHGGPACRIVYHRERRLLISASWDESLHIIRPYESDKIPPSPLRIPSKPHAIALSKSRLIVAMSERRVYIWDIAALDTFSAEARGQEISASPIQKRESSLRFLTRSIIIMPNDDGFVSSSIEGRVAVEWFDEAMQAKNYAFKSHRQISQDQETGEEFDEVFPVNALAFHPKGTFVTCGGDGAINLWDPVAKRRIKGYPKYDSSVEAVAFSEDGSKMVVGVSPGFYDGDETSEESIDQSKVQVWIRELGEGEMKQRAK